MRCLSPPECSWGWEGSNAWKFVIILRAFCQISSCFVWIVGSLLVMAHFSTPCLCLVMSSTPYPPQHLKTHSGQLALSTCLGLFPDFCESKNFWVLRRISSRTDWSLEQMWEEPPVKINYFAPPSPTPPMPCPHIQNFFIGYPPPPRPYIHTHNTLVL